LNVRTGAARATTTTSPRRSTEIWNLALLALL
jgi:hypothetical protein